MRADEKELEDRLRSLARLHDPDVVRAELEEVRNEDLAEAFLRIDLEESLSILQQLDPVRAADLLVDLPTETAKRLVDELPDAAVAHYLDVLPMDDAVDLREELEPERFEALLEVIPTEDAQEIRRLMSYPEDSAGQLMTEAFFAVAPQETASQVLEEIRAAPEGQYETVNDIYVVDERDRLLGVFSLREAVRAAPEARADEIMHENVISCSPRDDAEEVARQIARYGFYAMPVIDERGRMLGIFTVDDAQGILAEADTEDVLMLGAVSGDADSYLSLSVFQLVKRRLPWLFALFVAETLTGQVLRWYGQSGDAGEGFNHLIFFIPLIIGAGGNSGSQVTTTITRALAIGEVRTSDYLRVLRRELMVAVFIGGALGLAGFLRAILGWRSGFEVSLVVGLALPMVVLWAATVGSLLPLGAKRLGIDPAVMSAPFITTFVDATGLVIYFEIARQVLGSLAAAAG